MINMSKTYFTKEIFREQGRNKAKKKNLTL